MKKKTKRVILGEGRHWFFSKSSLEGKSGGQHDLIGLIDNKEGGIKPLKNLIQSRSVKLILEYEV
jgi:hypothetical protein